MKTLEQLLTIGSYAGLGLLLNCTADTADNKNNDSGSESCVAWEQTFGESEYDKFYSVQQTTDGGYILAGYNGSKEIVGGWLVKTDENGSKQWEQTFDDAYIYSVQQTSDEGYVMAGAADYSGAGSWDSWLVKTDENGNKEWEQTFGGSSYNYIYSVQQTTDGGYVLAGRMGSSGLLIKTDGNGNKQWEQTFEEEGYGTFSSVMQTTHEDYILAGQTGSSGLLVKICDL